MAGPFAIAAVGKTILSLLAAAAPAEFSSAAFELYQSKDLQSPMPEGVSLYLHRVTAANDIRNLPPRIASDGRRFRPSMRVDLHYLLVAWAQNAFKQQRLLGWAMRTIEDTPTLHASLLNQVGPETDIFEPDESLDILMETISIQDLSTVWDTAKTQMQPCAMYVVRMLTLESAIEQIEGERVQVRDFGMGKVVAG